MTIRLSDVEPPVWRRIRISSGAKLARAARVFAVSMGWSAGRPYAFTAGHLRYEGRQVAGVWEHVVNVRLRQVLPDAGSEFEFEYGEEHGWHLVARLDRLLPPNDGMRTPLCIGGEGAAPPLDVGGPWAYEEWRAGESSDTSSHAVFGGSESRSERSPVGVRFNPDAVNAELERLK